MADYGGPIKAFPRAKRLDLLVLLYKKKPIRGGAFTVLINIFTLDIVVVWQSGSSQVDIVDGLPEGGTLRPMAYVVLPDSLARCLRDQRLSASP